MSELTYDVSDGIGHVTFNRPAQRNALTFAMYDGLAEICDNPGDVRALIISGGGRGVRRRDRHEPVPGVRDT